MIRIATFMACLATPCFAQDPAADAAAQLLAAEVQLQAAETASDRIAALTETVRAYEAGLAAMRAAQRDIALQEDVLATAQAAGRDDLAQLLGVLSAIGATPQPVRQAHPGGPLATARAGMMLADVTPALRAKVAEVQAGLAEVRALAAARAEAAQSLQDGLTGAQAARAALGQAMSHRTDLPQRFVDDPVQTALLAASAETLGGFASEIARNAPDTTQALRANGSLPLPVAGLVLPDDNSGRPGVRIATVPRALVTTPVAATLLYQGPLLDYGTVVILEPAPDVLFVLAGLEAVFAATGAVLPAGAPVGLMGASPGFDDGILTENTVNLAGQGAQTLYLEVRDGQSSVGADIWFALE
ncbi:MAG: hypothetical protein AAGF56_04670 [Pseudomonadota bacterium]